MSESGEERKENAVGKVRLPERSKKDFTYLKNYFTEVAEDEASNFNLDPNEKSRFKTMCIQYLNLVLKTQRDVCEYVAESQDQDFGEGEAEDELFEQKSELLKRVLVKKMDHCKATAPSPMNIELTATKPENLYILKNGVDVPIQSQLNFSALQQSPQRIQQLHDQQHHFCNLYRQLLTHQKWLGDKKI